jgi:DNA-binding LytR/AlgR family response regulator
MPDCVIAEDEELLRAALIEALRGAWPELDIVAECEDGGAALDEIAARQPDVAFLDIRMPGLNGLEVAQAMLDVSPHTQIVFVTAYDQYAISAFENGVIDYLLKPVAPARLAATVARRKARAQAGNASPGQADPAALQELVRQLGNVLPRAQSAPPLVWLTASSGNETRLIMVDDVAYFQSDSKYTLVMTAEGEALLRKPLKDIIAGLDPALFKQVHRGTVVNLKAVASVLRDDTGKGVLKLKTRPETLTVSRAFMSVFRGM